jgi:hypothetical protein
MKKTQTIINRTVVYLIMFVGVFSATSALAGLLQQCTEGYWDTCNSENYGGACLNYEWPQYQCGPHGTYCGYPSQGATVTVTILSGGYCGELMDNGQYSCGSMYGTVYSGMANCS